MSSLNTDNTEDDGQFFILVKIETPPIDQDTSDVFKLRHLIDRTDIEDDLKGKIEDIADVFELIARKTDKPTKGDTTIDGLPLIHSAKGKQTSRLSAKYKNNKKSIKKAGNADAANIDTPNQEADDEPELELTTKKMHNVALVDEQSTDEPPESDTITITEIARIEDEMKELVNIPGFTVSELLSINKLLKEDGKQLAQEVIEKPFMIIDLVKHGLLPIYNEEFTFETRILINTAINALHENDLNFLNIYYQKLLTSPSKSKNNKKVTSSRITKLLAVDKTAATTPADDKVLHSPIELQEHALQEQTMLPMSLIKTKLKRFGPNQAINIIGFLVPVNFFRKETLSKLVSRVVTTSANDTPIEQLSTCITNVGLRHHELSRLTMRPPIRLSLKYSIADIEDLYHNIKWAAIYYKQQFPALESHEILDNIITRPVIELKKNGKPADKATIEKSASSITPINIVNFMKEHGLITFETPFLDAIFCELYNVNLLELYIYKYILGVDLAIERHVIYDHIASAINKDLLLLRQYEYVYRILYGVQTYNRLMTANPNIQTSIQFINLLTDVERAEIMAEYERQMAYWKSFLDNKCDHKSALYSFYRAVSIEDQAREYKALKEYIDYIPGSREHSYVKCKVCKFDLVCPHKLASVDYMTQGFALNRRVNNLHMELNAFADNDINDSRFYFCIICGERLFERDEWLGAKLDVAIPYEERRTMWYEAGIIINRFVTFTIAIDVQNTIDLMVKFCYPILLDYTQKLYIDATNEAEFSLMIKIVFAAYFDKMMKSSNKMVTFDVNQFERTLSIKERDRFKKLFKEIGERVTNQKIADRELFVYTYSLEERIADMVLKDPIFALYYQIHNGEIVQQLTERDINSYMAMAHLYDIIKPREVKQFDYKAVIDKYDSSTILDSDYNKEINKLTLYLRILQYNMIIKYIKNISKWNKIFSIVPNTIENRHLFDPSNSDKNTIEVIDTIQEVLTRYGDAVIRRPRWSPKMRTDEKFQFEEIYLGELYDEYGTKHVWDSFVLDKSVTTTPGNKPTTTNTADKIIKRKDYTMSMGRYSDLYASNTKVYLSKVRELDEKKIKDALRSANLIINVFNYYATRCPEGGIHERKTAADKCSKCDIQQNMNEVERKKYVIKYMKVYNDELAADLASDEYAESLGANKVKKTEQDASDGKLTVVRGALSDKYKYDENTIKLVAGKLGIEFNALRHLGAMQGHLYNDIIKGFITPALPKNINEYRIALLHSYVTMYLTYKSAKRLLNSREFAEYNENRKLAFETSDVKTIVYFHIMFICHDLITFMSQHASEAKEVINSILRSDMLLCKNSLSVFELREMQDDIITVTDEYAEKLDEENPASLSYDGFDFEGFDDADNVD